jgi:hypothetical protein
MTENAFLPSAGHAPTRSLQKHLSQLGGETVLKRARMVAPELPSPRGLRSLVILAEGGQEPCSRPAKAAWVGHGLLLIHSLTPQVCVGLGPHCRATETGTRDTPMAMPPPLGSFPTLTAQQGPATPGDLLWAAHYTGLHPTLSAAPLKGNACPGQTPQCCSGLDLETRS